MGRHADKRAPVPRRRRALTVVIPVLLLIAVIVLVVAVNARGHSGSGPSRADKSATPSTVPSSAGPAAVIPGVAFDTRIYTLKELKKQYAAKGMVYVTGDPSEPTTFVAASYNVLGSSHAGGGPSRAARGGALLKRKGVSVVGLQELQSNQRNALINAAGFEAYPPTSQGHLNGENSIAWDPGVWELVKGETQRIPYFFGKGRQMPLVLLRNITTGRLIWWMNVHNPADVFGCKCGGWRAKAISVEIAKINQLHKDGTPVFFTGDLNDRGKVVCRVAVGTGMVAADGSHSEGGSCRAARSLWIDWIWGSGDQVDFSAYNRDYRTRNKPRMSDHPMITATTTIAPAKDDNSCKSYRRHSKVYWFCPDPTAAVAKNAG